MTTAKIAAGGSAGAMHENQEHVSPGVKAFVRVATSLWIILFLAMGLRLAYGWFQVSHAHRDSLPAFFEQETGNIASSLATGKGYTSPWGRETGPTAMLTPGYPVLIAGIFRIFGVKTVSSFYASVLMNIVFSVATCIPIFYVGKRVAGGGAAAGAAWTWALFPTAIIFPFQWIWDTSLSALLVATLLWATLRIAESVVEAGRWRDWIGYGLLWGFALMVNPALASLLPFWLGYLAYHKRGQAPQSFRARFAKPALSAAIAVLCCVPWTVRNYLVFHEFVPLRSNLGLELYVGNNENYDDVHPRVWPYLITRDREIYRFFRMGEMPFMHEEMRKAVDFIVSHPRVEVRLTAQRVVAFWMGTATPYRDFLRADTVLLQAVSLCSLLAVLGTVGGIVVLYRRHREFAFPLAVCPIVFPLLYYATHGSLRYRHPLDPVIALLATIAVTGAWQAISKPPASEAKSCVKS
jgi:hypothetical protein